MESLHSLQPAEKIEWFDTRWGTSHAMITRNGKTFWACELRPLGKGEEAQYRKDYTIRENPLNEFPPLDKYCLNNIDKNPGETLIYEVGQ